MIIDNLKTASRYAAMCEGLAKGFSFIERAKKENLAVGKYEIDGDNVFAMVQEYDTKVASKTESHLKYIDIQCTLFKRIILIFSLFQKKKNFFNIHYKQILFQNSREVTITNTGWSST